MPYSGEVEAGHGLHSSAPSEYWPSGQNSQELFTGCMPGLHGGQAAGWVLAGRLTDPGAFSLQILGSIHLYIF